MGIVYFEALI